MNAACLFGIGLFSILFNITRFFEYECEYTREEYLTGGQIRTCFEQILSEGGQDVVEEYMSNYTVNDLREMVFATNTSIEELSWPMEVGLSELRKNPKYTG